MCLISRYENDHGKARRCARCVVYRKDLLGIRREMVGLGLLFAVVVFNLGTVCTSVGINAWNRGFYNALQAFDRGQIFRRLGGFFILGSLGITI
jgi:ABC-type uncharacterized transport system fused permease/ATPase subunit